MLYVILFYITINNKIRKFKIEPASRFSLPFPGASSSIGMGASSSVLVDHSLHEMKSELSETTVDRQINLLQSSVTSDTVDLSLGNAVDDSMVIPISNATASFKNYMPAFPSSNSLEYPALAPIRRCRSISGLSTALLYITTSLL